MIEIIAIVNGKDVRVMIDVTGSISIIEAEKGRESPFFPARCWLHTVVGSYFVKSSYDDLVRAVARRRQQVA